MGMNVVCIEISYTLWSSIILRKLGNLISNSIFGCLIYSKFLKDLYQFNPPLHFQADLIHLGAKYSPCMRKDQNVEDAITGDRRLESETACSFT